MRICLVTPGFSAHESDWCIPALRHLVEGLVAAGCQVHVLALRYPYRPGRYTLRGANVTALGGGQRQGWRSAGVWRRGLAALAAEHRRQRFDVIHAFWATESGALAALAGRALGLPTIVSLAGGELASLPDIAYGGRLARGDRLKVMLALRLAGAVTAGSQDLLARAAPWLQARPAGQVQRVPLGVNLELFSPGPGAPSISEPPRLIHVGSLTPVKDQTTLLQAAARLRDLGAAFRLDIAGEGPLAPQLTALAAQLDLEAVVRFCGAIAHHHLPDLYRIGTLFVSSSRHEAQSMVVLEAAACGLPVVGTQAGVVPELAPDGALVVPVADPAALAEALGQIVADPEQGQRMGRAARRLVEQEFGLDRCVQRFCGLYGALRGTKGRTA